MDCAAGNGCRLCGREPYYADVFRWRMSRLAAGFSRRFGAAAAATTRSLFAEFHRPVSARAKLSRIGIQLYTVRASRPSRSRRHARALAKIGYKEVEFAGYYKHPAAEVRDMLKQNG